MAQPTETARISPMLVYDDAATAIDFLCRAFGFEERSRMEMPDGRIGHAEVRYRDSVVMLASTYPELGLASPADLDRHHCQLYCEVDDLDAHFQNARANGATIATEPRDQDYAGRNYRALDSEGHRWIFGQRMTESDARP